MSEANRKNIELYLATERLLQHGGRTAERLSERGHVALARALEAQLSSLVTGLAVGQRRELAWVLECLQMTLDLAFRRLGIWSDLISAFAALERVEERVFFPEERDGPPRVVWEPPDDETRAVSWGASLPTDEGRGVRCGVDQVAGVQVQ